MSQIICSNCNKLHEDICKYSTCDCGFPVNNMFPYVPKFDLKDEDKLANTRQVGGQHYKTTTGKEHWDIVAEFGLDYFQGNITKYVMRWRDKGKVEDLKKARHYLDKYIELVEAGGIK